jgi:hypothetical protein
VKVPAVAVDGVGAVGLPAPPLAVAYQRRVLPGGGVAVSAAAASPTQYVAEVAGEDGAAGGVQLTVTNMRSLTAYRSAVDVSATLTVRKVEPVKPTAYTITESPRTTALRPEVSGVAVSVRSVSGLS